MKIDLINLQRNCPATAVIVFGEHYKKLKNSIGMSANISDELLFNLSNDTSFKQKLEKKAKEKDIVYLVIYSLDKVAVEIQNRFITLVKDRMLYDYTLPDNVIIVFSCENKDTVKKISRDLYHYCIVAE